MRRNYLQFVGELGQGVEETKEELVQERREVHGDVCQAVQHELVLRLSEHPVDAVLEQLFKVRLARALARLRLRVAVSLLRSA